jgi:fructokinase
MPGHSVDTQHQQGPEHAVRAPGKLLAGVELGGTKCVCILGSGPDDLRAREVVPTTGPAETLARIERILTGWPRTHGPVAALGIASFGPLDLDPTSLTYGHIVATVKAGWSNTEVAGRLARCLGVPVSFNTDVNAAALAEGRWGCAQGLENFVYITVGTGVGAGLIVAGRPVQGFGHSELGHVRVIRMPGDTWAGNCPYHGDCLEGLASGPAISARAGAPAERLPANHLVWESVAFALGQLLHTLVLATAPRKIILGGGVMAARPHLFVRLRENLHSSLNGYIEAPEIAHDLNSYIVPPGLGALAGPLGALALAADTLTG